MTLLSVIIPVYNEAPTLSKVLQAVRAVPLDLEIVVVDGASTDGTREILEMEERRGDLLVIYQENRNGRGGALREGMAAAQGAIIVFQDADLELDPACFPDLVKPLQQGEADVVFGSRFLRGRPNMTPLQYWGNRTVTGLLNVFWGASLTDAETCYQVFRREITQSMRFDRSDMSFTVELTLRFLRARCRIEEVPVDYFPRSHNEGKKLYWGDGFVSLWVLVKYRIKWMFGDFESLREVKQVGDSNTKPEIDEGKARP